MELVVSIQSTIDITPAGILRAAKWRLWEKRNAAVLRVRLQELVAGSRYRDLFSDRVRGHLFVQFDNTDRVVEGALFPSREPWCQLCALEFDERTFRRLSLNDRLGKVVDCCRQALENYRAKARDKVESKQGIWGGMHKEERGLDARVSGEAGARLNCGS
jgi:hypothetical protein